MEDRLVVFSVVAAGLAALAWALLLHSRRRQTYPHWPRMLAETDYYRQALSQLFRQRGYTVMGSWVMRDPQEREPREILFSLRKNSTVYAALCVRWVVPVTSDVIERFEGALAATRAETGMIVTTSTFTPAALERARGLPVQLFERRDVLEWIASGARR